MSILTVQLNHPGAEKNYRLGGGYSFFEGKLIREWNADKSHYRKFIHQEGEYIKTLNQQPMKTNKEIVDLLVTAILKKCKEPYLYDKGICKEEVEATIDDIEYYMYVEIWYSYGYYYCDIKFDLWDVHGSKIKTNKNNIRNEVEKQIIKYYEQ
jgi:hypothetical protein